MSRTIDVDVAIVGGGIAGPALACALASSGRRIVLIERSADPLDTARGDQLQPITGEWLTRWDALETFWRFGAEKRLGSRWFTPEGDTVLHAPVDNLDIPHPYYIYLNHERISAGLLEVAGRNPGFACWRPATARLIHRDDGRHALEVERNHTAPVTIEPRLIVAADGRNSRLRKALGIEVRQHAYQNPLIVLFAPRTRPDTRNEVHVYLTPAGVISVVPRMRGGWKIGFPVPRASVPDWRRAGTTELADYLVKNIPALAGIAPELAGVYPVAMINARRWTDGNALLLGDACHALHPGRSQGMNVAMRSVLRLAELLSNGQPFTSSAAMGEALVAFEADLKPPIETRLADNHARGLEMDGMEPAGVAAIRARMEAIAASPEKLRAYCLSSAGY